MWQIDYFGNDKLNVKSVSVTDEKCDKSIIFQLHLSCVLNKAK